MLLSVWASLLLAAVAKPDSGCGPAFGALAKEGSKEPTASAVSASASSAQKNNFYDRAWSLGQEKYPWLINDKEEGKYLQDSLLAAQDFGAKDPVDFLEVYAQDINKPKSTNVIFREANTNLADPEISKLANDDLRRLAAVEKAITAHSAELVPPGLKDIERPGWIARHAKMLVSCSTGLSKQSVREACYSAIQHLKGPDFTNHAELVGIDIVPSDSLDKAKARYAALPSANQFDARLDTSLDYLRFVNPREFAKTPSQTNGAEMYGVANYAAWKNARDYLDDIPLGKLDLSVDLFANVHKKATASLHPRIKSLSRWIPQGWVPSAGGVLKKHDTVGKYALTHPLSEEAYQALRANPDLGGFVEIPVLSKPGARRGWIVYAPAAKTKEKLGDLIKWYKENDGKMDPIELAARFQYRYVSIHPMIDGNGMASRLLMDRILEEHHLPPAIIDDTEADILLPVDKYIAKVRQGVDRFLTIRENVKNLQDGAPRNSSLGALALESSNHPDIIKDIQGINYGFQFTASDKAFQIDNEDGFLYDRRGVPYVFHEGKIYPIADRTYRLLEMNVPRNGQDLGLSPANEEYVRSNIQFVRDVRDGKVDPGKIPVEPYETVNSAEKTGEIFLYPWQRKAFEHAIKIDATDPKQIMMPFRAIKTTFDGSAMFDSKIQPYQVLAQYEMVDRVYYGLEQTAKKQFPELISQVEDSRRKVFEAARKLLQPYLEARAAIAPEHQGLVASDKDVKLFDAYLSHSKLAYASYDEARNRVDDKYMYLLRSDSSAVNYTGFLSPADFVKVFNKLPMSGKVKELIYELSDYLKTPGGHAEVQEKVKAIQSGIAAQNSLFSKLPESIKRHVNDLSTYYDGAERAVNYLASTILASKYSSRPVGDEYERVFVSQAIHADGFGLKDEKSFTTNTKLMESFPFAENPLARPQISLVRVAKTAADVNYGTNSYTEEYEVLGTKPIGPWNIVQKFSQDDLSDPADSGETLPEDVKNFTQSYFNRDYSVPGKPRPAAVGKPAATP
jgi:hypothetical protein